MTTEVIIEKTTVNVTVDATETIVEASIGKKTVVEAQLSTSPFSAASLGAGTHVYAGSGGGVAKFRSLLSSNASVLFVVTPEGEIDLSSDASVQLQIFELKNTVKVGVDTYYSELGYDGDENIDTIEKWLLPDKVAKLFTKVLEYTSGNISKVITTDETTNAVLTSSYTYDVNDNIKTIIEVLT